MAQELQDSAVMRAMSELQNFSAVRMARELQDSPAMRAALELQSSSAMGMARELQDSAAMRAAVELQSSSAVKMVRDLQDSSAMRAVLDLENSPAMRTIQRLRDLPITHALHELESSSMMKALGRLEGAPFDPELIQKAVSIAQNAQPQSQTDSHGEILEQFAATGAELDRLGDDNLDFSSLSENSKRFLLWFINAIVLPFLISVAANLTMERFNQKVAEGKNITTTHEAKKLSRCADGLEREMFSGCRVVTGDGLRLRRGPGMKSDIVTTLPVGSVIFVLDSSSRSWLSVEVDVEGNPTQGWVARRYTRRFR